MPAPSKRAKKIRAASEFSLAALAKRKSPPKGDIGALLWSVDDIRSARSQQMVGNFRRAAMLASAMNADGAIFAARQNRLAPQQGLARAMKPRGTTPLAARIAAEADSLVGPQGVGVTPDTLVSINDQLAMHAVGFGACVFTPRPDGSRVDVEMVPWPIEWVSWNPQRQCFQTQTEDEGLVDIVHGDGRWVIFQNQKLRPWTWGAVVPLAMIWADRAFGTKDRSGASNSHGTPKFAGELPEKIPLQDADGNPTAELAAILELLRGFAQDATPYGVKPAGTKLEMLTNSSTAWQIFDSIINSNSKDANSVLLGQDGTSAASGGNYVKAELLFGVRNDIIEADLGALERGLLTGVIEPWCAINFGTSALAPEAVWLMPDADEDARIESLGKQDTAFFAAIDAAKASGFVVDQAYVEALAKRYKIATVPTLAALKSAAPLAPQGSGGSVGPGSEGATPPPLRIVPP